MIKSTKPFVEVFKYFLVIYLQNDYVSYLASSSIDNKLTYLDYAIKLAYTLEVSKETTELFLRQARTGLQSWYLYPIWELNLTNHHY